jgi:hypothetical protein
MSCKESAEMRLQVRLYTGQDDDLLQWLAQFDAKPYGAKSQAVKDALRRGIGIDTGAGQPTVAATSSIDLAELRRVMEAAVDGALNRFGGRIGGGARAAAQEQDDETESLLDDLQAALVLEEDA